MLKKIFTKKEKGIMSEYTIGMLFVLFGILLAIFIVKNEQISNTKRFARDGLDAACLSSALVDLNVYGTSNAIVCNNVRNSYSKFISGLKTNFELNNELNSTHDKIKGAVKVEKYILYNVKGNDVEVNEVDSIGNITTNIVSNGKGVTRTPKGELVESTTVYGEISFEINGIGEILEFPVKVKSTVDVVDEKF